MERVSQVEAARAAALEHSQTLIVNLYTLIAVLYCGASALLFYTVVHMPFLGLVHLVSLTVISANFLVLQVTRDYRIATHVILLIGTLVVGSLFGTGGWGGTGPLWTFAYLPYAFFLGSTAVARFWVGFLVLCDTVLVVLGKLGRIPWPYDDVQLTNFGVSLGVFLLCMFLFKRASLQSERLADRRSQELAQTNLQLQASEADLAQAQASAHLGSWSWDPATDAAAWSAEMRNLFGIAPDAPAFGVAGVRRFLHNDDVPELEHMLANVKAGMPFDFEARIVRSEGAVRLLRVQGRPERGPAGQVLRYAGTAQDITELREAEEARRRSAIQVQELESLKEINRLKTQFMNTAAHELSTPLTPITLELRALKNAQDEASPVRRRKALAILERNLERLGLLVRDLLEGARLQSGQVVLKRQSMDLAPLVREAVQAQAIVAKDAGVQLTVAPMPALWTEGDPKRLAQVLDNLLANAIKFTPAGGTVQVRGLRGSGGISVRVEDSGIGLRADQIPRLFQPFSQVHSTMDRTRSGTGLGLYICKGIVEAHGGRIGVESAGTGKGATFWFVLAAASPVQSDGASGPVAASDAGDADALVPGSAASPAV